MALRDRLYPMKNDCTYGPQHLDEYILENTPDRTRARYEGLVEYALGHDFGVLDHVVVIDTETTGFSFKNDELTQIAAARISGREIEDWFVTFVNPGKPIPDDVKHLTHITEDMVADAPTPYDALAELAEFVGDSPLVAHNAAFDRTFVTKTPSGYGMKDNLWIDSLDLARIGLPRLKSHRLLDLVRAFGGPDSTHRADDDVASTCLVYRVLLASIATMPQDLLHHIAQMSPVEKWNTAYVFQVLSGCSSVRPLNGNDVVNPNQSEASDDHEGDKGANCFNIRKSRLKAVMDEVESLRRDAFVPRAAEGDDGKSIDIESVKNVGLKAKDTTLTSHNDVEASVEGACGAGAASDLDVSHETFEGVIVGVNPDGTLVYDKQDVSRETVLPDSVVAAAESNSGISGELPTKLVLNTGLSEEATEAVTSMELVFATSEEIESAFTADGLVGSLYENYESREEQKLMALSVNNALKSSRNLVVEAGTGVGKSMAYLVPLVLAAKKNHITVGVATKTNALLDQLVNKELPLLNEALGVSCAPLKGFTHYPCLRKVQRLDKRGPAVVENKGQYLLQTPSLAALLSFVEQTDYDDMDALKIDYRAIPRYSITTNSNECLRRKCPFFGRTCFVHGAREQAQRSDVVVTNHSLLFYDVKLDGGLLPPIRYWAVDEAHGAESEARRALSVSLSSEQVSSLSQRVSSESASSNVFLRTKRNTSVTGEAQRLFDSLVSKALTAGGAFSMAANEFVMRTKDLLYFDSQQKKSGYERFELWLNEEIRGSSVFSSVKSCAQAMKDTLDKLIRASRDIVVYFESVEISSPEQRAVALAALEMKEVSNALDAVFFSLGGNQVRSIRLNRVKDRYDEVFSVQPLDVGAQLNDLLYTETNSVVFASATLTVDGKFDTVEKALGLNQGPESLADFVQVDSSYDFDSHMRVYVPNDIPEPQDAKYLKALQEFLTDLHLAQNGAMLTLFTNRKEMERCFDEVNPALKENELRLVCQKWGVSVKNLRDDFLKDESLSLFALKSFWEGFDAPGSTLRGVVIPKLPFGLPTDPLSCERKAIDQYAWSHYSLPQAVIEVKQAVGRLIRTANDEGIVVLADKRLLSKQYGKKFLNSLPSKNVSVLSMSEIVEEVARLNVNRG